MLISCLLEEYLVANVEGATERLEAHRISPLGEVKPLDDLTVPAIEQGHRSVLTCGDQLKFDFALESFFNSPYPYIARTSGFHLHMALQ